MVVWNDIDSIFFCFDNGFHGIKYEALRANESTRFFDED